MHVTIPDQKPVLDFYGEDLQTLVACEELGELIQAASKMRRADFKTPGSIPTERREHLIEELGDALVCLEQLKLMYGISDKEIESGVKAKCDLRRRKMRMTLVERFVQDEVFVDFGAEYLLGDDQACVSTPVRFPTVLFQLMPTAGMIRIADCVRQDAGYEPLCDMDDCTDDACDNKGCYEFYIGLNGYTDTHLDSALLFCPVNTDSDDNEEVYSIDLTYDEQLAIYNRLDEQCRKYLGKSCEDLLEEAKEQMERDAAGNQDDSWEREELEEQDSCNEVDDCPRHGCCEHSDRRERSDCSGHDCCCDHGCSYECAVTIRLGRAGS